MRPKATDVRESPPSPRGSRGQDPRPLLPNLSLILAQRVEFDLKEAVTIYVTTFGGSVWKGKAK
jgi:hypothetical protein